jgi:hypothetical protein
MRLEYSTYEEAKKNFKWSERWEVFDGNRERFNIAHECVTRHASDEVAIRIKFDDRHKEIYTFKEFDRLVSQFAHMLGESVYQDKPGSFRTIKGGDPRVCKSKSEQT